MAAARYDFEIKQGSDFLKTFTFKEGGVEIDLTGRTYQGQIRKVIKDVTNPVVATLTITVPNQVTRKGEIDVTLAAADSTAIVLKVQKTQERALEPFAYDIEEVLAGPLTDRVLEGIVYISPEVTT